jgi:hypothetical protein
MRRIAVGDPTGFGIGAGPPMRNGSRGSALARSLQRDRLAAGRSLGPVRALPRTTHRNLLDAGGALTVMASPSRVLTGTPEGGDVSACREDTLSERWKGSSSVIRKYLNLVRKPPIPGQIGPCSADRGGFQRTSPVHEFVPEPADRPDPSLPGPEGPAVAATTNSPASLSLRWPSSSLRVPSRPTPA